MKPKVKITITEARQLQEICNEAGIKPIISFDNSTFVESVKNAKISVDALNNALRKLDNRTWFEKIYDLISFWLCAGKSFAPNELKTFR